MRFVRVVATTLIASSWLAMTTLSGARASDIEQPYPGDARAEELKGAARSDDPVVLNVTHEAALALEADDLNAEAQSVGPEIYAGSLWNSAKRTLTLRLTTNPASPDARTTAMMERVAARTRGATVRFEQVGRSAVELNQLARRLIDEPQTWAPGLKGQPGGGYFPAEDKVILFIMAQDSPGEWVKAAERLGDPSVEVRVANLPENGAGSSESSRVADNPGWSGGARLNLKNGILNCTAGFNWRRWGGGEEVGSTASHCAESDYYNNGQLWGTAVISSPIADAVLLRSSKAYSATVYVGNQTTTDYRVVTALDSSWMAGEVVALSAAATGLTTANVSVPDYTLPSAPECGGGLRGVLMNRHNSAGGDSGGPWLTTQTDGDVTAHGQHHGFDACGTGYSFFVPLTTISSRLSASLMLG